MKFFSKLILLLLVLAGTDHTGFAQEFSSPVVQQYDAYRKTHFREKVYLHSDKQFYLAGEIIWFKAYAVDAAFHRPAALSKTGYIELLDRQHQPVMQVKIALDSGQGKGSFFLPSSIESGHYYIRAYTALMKNYGAGNFFEKQVTIINSLKSPTNILHDTTALQYALQLLPEGGQLVQGLESRIGFKISDMYGKGVTGKGVVINSRHDTLVHFTTLQFGMGSFRFTPVAGETYTAVAVLDNGQIISAPLPAVAATGYTMQVDHTAGNMLRVTVRSNNTGTSQQEILLMAHTRQDIRSVEKKYLRDGAAIFSIPSSGLGDGISILTVFNNNQQPVCERLVFKKPEHLMSVEARSDYKKYDTRQHININLQTGKKDLPTTARLSVAVYRIDSLQQPDELTIDTYLWLTSDLSGKVESPGYYLYGTGAGVQEATDNLMLVHGWRTFNWNDRLSGNSKVLRFAPEYDGQIITGKVIDVQTGQPAPDVVTYLSIPNVNTQFYTSISDKDGMVRFDVREFYGPGEIVLQAKQVRNKSYRIDIINSFAEDFAGDSLPPLSITSASLPLLTGSHINMQVQNTFHGNEYSNFILPAIDTMAFFGNPDKKYLLDDYVRFTTMEEVLREYVPEVMIRRQDGQLHLFMLNLANLEMFKADPLMLIDGVPVNNTTLLGYDPLKVRKLELTANRYITGDNTFYGIVSFTTYHGEMPELKLDNQSVILDYEGLQLQRKFYAPAYETEAQTESRIPDFRNVLLWAPEIKTDTAGKASVDFYSSDLPGRYVIVVEGLNSDGYTGSALFDFEVSGRR